MWEVTAAAREGSRWRLAWVWATELELMVTLSASGAEEEEEEGWRVKSVGGRGGVKGIRELLSMQTKVQKTG